MTNNKFFQGLEVLENGGVIADKVNDILESGYVNETTQVEELIAGLHDYDLDDVTSIEEAVNEIYNSFRGKVNYLFHDMSEMDFVELPTKFVNVDIKAFNRYLKKQAVKEWDLISEDYVLENLKVGYIKDDGYYVGTPEAHTMISVNVYDALTLTKSDKSTRKEVIYLDSKLDRENCIEYSYEFDASAEEGMEELEITTLICENKKFPKVLKNIIADPEVKKLFEDEKKEKAPKASKVEKVQTGSAKVNAKKQLTEEDLASLGDLEEL